MLKKVRPVIASENQIAGNASQPDPPSAVPSAVHGMTLPLTRVFRPGNIHFIRPGSDVVSAIRQLVQSLADKNRIRPGLTEKIVRQLIQRESYGSSAIGKGLAFPHLRTADVQDFIGAIGICPEGMDFGAIDRGLTKLIFLTLSPVGGREQHMLLLSRLVSLMKDHVVSLRLHHPLTTDDIYQYLADLDGEFIVDSDEEKLITTKGQRQR